MALILARLVLQAAPLVAGLLVLLLGAIVLVGWVTNATAIVQIRPWLPAMSPLAAIGFVLAGSGLVAVRQGFRRVSMTAAAGVLAIVATLPLSFRVPILISPTNPGLDAAAPFGPNAAIAFLLAALALLFVHRSVYIAATLGVGVLSLGTVAILGYAVDVTPAIGWGGHARMSAHTALGFTLLGSGLVLLAFRREREMREDRSWWRPALVGMTAAGAGLLFWGALRVQEQDAIRAMVDGAALGIRNDMEITTDLTVLALGRLAEHGLAVGWQSAEDWQRDAQLTVGSFRGFESLEWVDASFVARVVASSPRAATLVVDEQNERRRKSGLERVRSSGEPVVIGPFDGAAGPFLRVIVPLGSATHPEAYLAGVFSTDRTLNSLTRHLSQGYSILILCEGREVYREGDLDSNRPTRWTRRVPLRLPGPVAWQLVVAPRSEVLAAVTTPLPTLALGSSFLIALLLTLTVRFGDMATLRARSLGEAVKERTRELELSMRNLQSEVAERRRTEAALRRTHTLGRVVSAELDLGKVVQAVTDAAAELTSARFGMLIYSVRDEQGASATHRAVSGDATILGPPDVLERLQAPRFDRAEPIRVDDLSKDPRSESLFPSTRADHGPGLSSYLAVPVLSRSGRVRGALQLGHSSPGVFGEREQEIAVSFAAQAAIAMDNAMLYESERQASERAQATNDAKDNFIHMLGHELRNPLGSIRTALQVLTAASRRRPRAVDSPIRVTEHDTEADGVRMRRIIDRQVDQLARLADDLLQVSQLSSDKLSLRPEAVDLGELVSESVESVRARFERAGLSLRTEIPEKTVTVWADPQRLRQVVANLLANARKFCDAGGVVVVGLDMDAGHRAVIFVKDTGCGIDARDLARVFDPFVQTELARNRMTGGLGLGLPIVKGLVEAQGGDVSAFSAGRDQGAEFRVRLPLHDAPASATAAPPARVAAGSRRILVIDDHRDSADALKRLLDLFGNDVEVAYDGPRGIELAHRFQPDVLICDIGLPGMDGFEVARRLGQDPATEAIRLIALTGYGDEDTIRAARAAGFRHHLTKPVETELLEQLLAEGTETQTRRPEGRRV